jgi:predicted molibdopterin-dependent oxidoreductase YjgC
VDESVDAYRLPLSAIRDAQLVVVVGDDPVVERAPIVDLWIKAARRNGADVVVYGPEGDEQRAPGSAAETCRELASDKRLRDAERVVLVWSGPHGRGGCHVAELAAKLGLADKPGSGVFYLPATPNGRGVAEAWAAASDEEAAELESVGLLIVSGDEAAQDPNVRALAERADAVIAITMFQGLAVGWADLVLPATSYLEREGTTVNLEGRLQRLRRAVIPPGPDEVAWIAKLAARFGVELSPYVANVFEELSAIAYPGLAYEEVGLNAPLRGRTEPAVTGTSPDAPAPARRSDGHWLGLVRYRPLFSGPAVERVPELQFQRPPAEIELSLDDAQRRGIATGDDVVVRSNGTSATLRARVNRRLAGGVVRVAEEHAAELHAQVEVTKA